MPLYEVRITLYAEANSHEQAFIAGEEWVSKAPYGAYLNSAGLRPSRAERDYYAWPFNTDEPRPKNPEAQLLRPIRATPTGRLSVQSDADRIIPRTEWIWQTPEIGRILAAPTGTITFNEDGSIEMDYAEYERILAEFNTESATEVDE